MQDGQFVQTGEPEAIIINPKTDYVKNFVKGADPSNVVTAKTIMSKKSPLVQQSPHAYVFVHKTDFQELTAWWSIVGLK